MVKFIVGISSDNPDDVERFASWVKENVKGVIEPGQQNLSVNEDGSDVGSVEGATVKQKNLLKRLHIDFSDDISKSEASRLISEVMDKNKEG